MKAFALTVGLLSVLSTAQAGTLRSEVEASNKTIHKAMMKKDFATLAKVMKAAVTPNFVYVENGKQQTFDQMMTGMKMGLSSMGKITHVDSRILSLKEKGNVAMGKTMHMFGGSMTGPDKKPHAMMFSGVSNDTYVKQGGTWKMSKMVWGSQKMTMDGKPFDPNKMEAARSK